MEEWKEVLGFDVLYEVSNMGRVRTRYSEKDGYTNEYRILIPRDNSKGYKCFNWKQGGNQRTVYLHRLVAEAFIPNPERMPEVNHRDEDKTNNNVNNLEWCTHLYNYNYGTRNARAAKKNMIKVQCIETGVVYESARHAAEAMGISSNAIHNCVKGYSHKSGGYSWRQISVHA